MNKASASSSSSWPELYVEQARRGERPWPDVPGAALQARREALDVDDTRVLARLPPETFAARVIAAAAAAPAERVDDVGPRRRAALLVPALAVAAMLVVVVRAPPSAPTDTAKGGPALLVHRRDGSTTVPVHSGDVVSAGDVVQLQTRAPGFSDGVVLSVDGAGRVTRHFPEDGRPTALPQGTAALPFSFELDDAPGFERFVFVAAHHALEPAAVELALRTATTRASSAEAAARAALVLPDDVMVTEVLLCKR
jgi:hypothetical protein